MTKLVPIFTAALGSLVMSGRLGLAQRPSFPAEAELRGKSTGELVLNRGTYGEHPADWGIMLVPENRSKPESRLMHLYLVRRSAQITATRPPIFHLVGGPGQSNVWGVHASAAFFQHQDFVQVGYRGIDSSVELKCPAVSKALTVNRPLSSNGITHVRKALQACQEQLRSGGVDIDGYTILEVVDDIEAARKALGYEKIDLFSTSYGTHVAYLYCRKYPRNVRRNLMVGAANISRQPLWRPDMVDKQLGQYSDLWRHNAEAQTRTADLLKTIREVLATLPREWNHVSIDPDKVRIAAFHMLYETETAALALDAFVAAEKGDYSGLAVMSHGYDQDILSSRGYWGDFFSKLLSRGFDGTRDYETEMDPPGSVLGAPLSKLFWGAAAHGGWTIRAIPEEYRALADIEVATLIVQGGLDFSGPPEYVKELEPYLKRGRIVVVPNMGHMDVIRLQHQAFEHLMKRFFEEGEIDTSKYAENHIDFTPRETLQDHAKTMFATQSGK